MKICSNCILPDTFPGTSFNDQGVCNHCENFKGQKKNLLEEKKTYQQKFFDLLNHLTNSQQGNHSYDILMAYSGGKDSTYTMSLLKKRYNLRVLAVSFDNGFISGTAITNIKKITDALGIDHIFFKPPWNVLKKIFRTASERELYSKKTLERASTICTSCMGIVKSICLKIAIEKNIPMIGYGWSPGQAPLQSSIMKNNPSLIRMTQRAILNPLREIGGKDLEVYFLNARHYAKEELFPYNVHLMAWEHYDEDMIINEIEKLGWTVPPDTDSNSTNCLLNAYANEVHIKQYGFHPYAWEIANMVREGVMARYKGIKKIDEEQPVSLINRVKHKLFNNGRD